MISPRQQQGFKKNIGRKFNSNFDSGKNTGTGFDLDNLIKEEEDEQQQDHRPQITLDSKAKYIFDHFQSEKKVPKTVSLLTLLNFEIKSSPFLMCSNINICEVNIDLSFRHIKNTIRIFYIRPQ